jgi:glutathione peroxidase-family protein
MTKFNQIDKNNFLYQYYKYQGQFTPENLAFNANLQEFSQRVAYICNLETKGKLSPQESYEQIQALWEQLTNSFQALGIGHHITH